MYELKNKQECDICGWNGFDLNLHKSLAHHIHGKTWYKNYNFFKNFIERINKINDINYLNAIAEELIKAISVKKDDLINQKRIEMEHQEKRFDEILASLKKEVK